MNFNLRELKNTHSVRSLLNLLDILGRPKPSYLSVALEIFNQVIVHVGIYTIIRMIFKNHFKVSNIFVY